MSVDLKPVSNLVHTQNDKRNILYMMNEFSRMTVATIVKSKDPEEIGTKILEEGSMKGLGYPSRYFFCNNGKEFQGGILDTIFRKTRISVKQTPAYSPWSNGGIERKHGAINLTIKKMMEDDSSLKF